MPFRSEAQRRHLYSTNPELAKKFEAETPNNADLPEHVDRPKRRRQTKVRMIGPAARRKW